MTFSGYSKRDTNIIKGFAILCIVLHNYFHWLWPSPGENEFDFAPERIQKLFQTLGAEPGEWVNLLFSYLGHYGVQLFILISGFGLTVSMMHKPRTWESFIMVRLKKLYPLFLVGILACFLGKIVMEGKPFGSYEWTEIGYKLLFIHTLMPNSGLSVNGPWWFFALIFQLYLLFPLLFRWIRKGGWITFACVCALCYGLIFLFRYVLTDCFGEFVMQNAPGHLPEFCLGMVLACHEGKRLHPLWLVLAVAVFCLGNFYALFYPFTFLALSVIAVFAYEGLKSLPLPKHWIGTPLAYFGGISMTMFAVHGYFRTPLLLFAVNQPGPWGHVLSGFYYLLVVWAIAVAAKLLYDFLCRQLDRIVIRENKVTRVLGIVFSWAFGLFFAGVLGYYIVNGVPSHNRLITEPIQMTESGLIEAGSEYAKLAVIDFEQHYPTLHIQVSFETHSLDTLTPLPSVVMNISELLWIRLELPKEYNTDGYQTYRFNYNFQCPFIKNLRGKELNIFFWNEHKGRMEFKNAKVELLH